MAARDTERDRRLIRYWLYVVAALLVVMILLGGTTRLTDSGLSITEWKPIHGVIPPLSQNEWQEEFAAYQQIPQYEQLNKGMTLGEFKGIFWWEWAHRLMGRLIGFVVLLPLIYFVATRRIERRLVPKIVVMLVLGGLQGVVGWWMVASGLVNRIDVSQYRLATHLTLAMVILAYVTWVAQSLAPASRNFVQAPAALRRLAVLMLVLVFVQIYLGGLVAGLNAGLTYNTWPLMDGRLVPNGMHTTVPLWRDFFENITTVQFDHRLVAYCVFAVSLVLAFLGRREMPGTRTARRVTILAGFVVVQILIGIAALLAVVPLPLALLHQLGATAVLAHTVVTLRGMTAPLPITERPAPTARRSLPDPASG